MKKLFTLSLVALFTIQFSSAQEVGFFPPEGSTFNADSSIVTLPNAMVGQDYNEAITFYAADTIAIEGIEMTLGFVSATITSVSTPNGMDYNCNIEDCAFVPNIEGEVSLNGIPTDAGEYTLDIVADVVVSIEIMPGFATEIPFTVPYFGGNPTLDLFLTDYSVLNEFIPTFILNVDSAIVGVEEVSSLSNVSVYPNPATKAVTFDLASTKEDVQVQIFDLLGNNVFNSSYTKASVTVNTSNFTNGVYIYKLTTVNESSTGRLIVNK